MRPVTGITILGFRLGVIALALFWCILFLGTHWPAGLHIVPSVGDKAKHFSGFFLLALMLCYVTGTGDSGFKSNWGFAKILRFAKIMGVMVAYACFDEYTQRFSPGRTPDVMDFVADVAGALSAICLYLLAKRCWMAIAKNHVRPSGLSGVSTSSADEASGSEISSESNPPAESNGAVESESGVTEACA